jgi:peptide/nickel transport system substrate-binding protein
VKEKTFSFLKRVFDLPRHQEVVYVSRTLPPKEKVIFIGLGIIFIFSTLVIVWKTNNSLLTEKPTSGGAFSEGVVGTPRFINPLLAVSDADRDLSALIYSGLMRVDSNGNLMPDMADRYEISSDGLSYTFFLKDNLKWHDGEAITADDVLFTIQQAKNPELKSVKRANWEGVDVQKIDAQTIKFTLKKPYSPFLENTTMGIIPEHIWKEASPEQMAFSEFNIEPIGSGPYKISAVARNSSGIISSYSLSANKNFSLGRPYIEKVTIRFYSSEKELTEAYSSGAVGNIGGVTPQNIFDLDTTASDIRTLNLPRIFAVFLNQNNIKAFAQKEVREALLMATDKDRIIKEVLRGFAEKINGPIPPGVFGVNETAPSTYDPARAKRILENSGWKPEKGTNILTKKSGKETLRLEFSLSTSDSFELKRTAELIKEMWEPLGIKVDLRIYEIGDLNQNIIRTRKYDALFFGEVVGRDSDPFAFWHSSQRNDPGLNIALYTNPQVDKLLEEARIATETEKRVAKYKQLQDAVTKDIPAIFVFSPDFIYITSKTIKGLDKTDNIASPPERFSQIYNWYIQTDKVWKIFAKLGR